ncbi:MAG: family 10 glycosylhydrolase, partial [Planctomycetia bacterium]|nr:family 10 glycosylhydrolase [Planctomycetia bacterium]
MSHNKLSKLSSSHLPKVLLFVACLFLLTSNMTIAQTSGANMSQDEYRKERDRLARVPRFSFNNDGCDVFYFPTKFAVTPQNLLDLRTTNLPNTNVTTLTYCTLSSGFGLFTHDTKTGELLSKSFDPTDATKKNVASDLIAGGKDVLQIMVDFCHANKLECFWSMRMNDTHDAGTRPDHFHPLYPQLKKDHPEWLVGSMTKRTKSGPWSSVNYAIPEIRDLAVAYVEDVCKRYDVDGIELDFCRHLCYFKTVAEGGVATQSEIAAMNDLMKQMRQVVDREGMRRNRPILLTVRIPDDLEYAKCIGLDFEYWMKERLADIFIGSDYFHLNQWNYWVAFGKKYNVPVYACLSESRVNKQDKRFSRGNQAAYAARSAAAWDAGVDGVHIFNVYTATAPFLNVCGASDKLKSVDKVYFQTTQYGGYRPTSYLKDGDKYRHLPILSPDMPWSFKANETQSLQIDLGNEP